MNASCAQYGINCPISLPFTGFNVVDAIALGALALCLGVYGYRASK